MTSNKKKYLQLFCILAVLTAIVLLTIFFQNKLEKEKTKSEESITINLFTSIHPNLPWRFSSLNKKIFVKPGEVKTIEYIVEKLEDRETTGIATFAYFPELFGAYIRKLDCFCYDAQTLEPKQKDTYSVVILIDPEVTKDSKTKNIKEVTIQFTFFNFKEYKESRI